MRARFWLAFILLAAVSLSAQTFRGTILGTVTDPSGAVVAGAKVSVKNTGTGLERSTETSGDGSYSLPELPIGTYNVTVTQQGFQTFVATGVAVDVATERRVDAALKTGEITPWLRSLPTGCRWSRLPPILLAACSPPRRSRTCRSTDATTPS